MRSSPHVKPLRIPPLRHPRHIDPGAQYVEDALQDEPGKTYSVVHGGETVEFEAVQDGDDGGEAHEDEHGGAVEAVAWSAESGVEAESRAD